MGWTKPSLFGFEAGVKIAYYGFGSPKLFLLHRLRNPAPPLRLFLHVPRYVQYNTGTVPNCFASSRALKTMPSCVSFAGYFNFYKRCGIELKFTKIKIIKVLYRLNSCAASCLKKTWPPGWRWWNMFRATWCMLSGWMADSTKISVTMLREEGGKGAAPAQSAVTSHTKLAQRPCR